MVIIYLPWYGCLIRIYLMHLQDGIYPISIRLCCFVLLLTSDISAFKWIFYKYIVEVTLFTSLQIMSSPLSTMTKSHNLNDIHLKPLIITITWHCFVYNWRCSEKSTQILFWRKWVIDGFDFVIGQKLFWQNFGPFPVGVMQRSSGVKISKCFRWPFMYIKLLVRL